MGKQHETMAVQRTAPRWKEWIPLVTQQLRLRNLIQIVAYNVSYSGKHNCDLNLGWELNKSEKSGDENIKKQKFEKCKFSFYYTLHLTTMSAPFYTSEKLESENPKWAEIEIDDLVSTVNSAVNGIIIRLWLHRVQEKDIVLTVWGVYFNGLIYLGPRLCSDPSTFCINTIVFHMPGGYFTAAECFKTTPSKLRHTKVTLNQCDVRPSYTVNLLLRLHTIQQAIKKQILAAQILREKIAAGGLVQNEPMGSMSLCKLLNTRQPNAPQRYEMLKVKREIELLRFKVILLSQEKLRKLSEVTQLEKTRKRIAEGNKIRGTNLMDRYQSLYKQSEQLKEWRKSYLDAREMFLHLNAQLIFRRRQLISELNFIYPIIQDSTEKFTIAGVHLPNSEDFIGHEESMISVALGYVAHVVAMISIFLQVPLRYPIIHFGSRSRIMDHISEKIPDKDREFPLYSRGKDRLQFNYGVYLLNKNIAQLRWYCGLPTQDLRATLPNLATLLQLNPGPNSFGAYQRTLSGSSLDMRSSSQNMSPVGSVQTVFRKAVYDKTSKPFVKGHRASKSMGSTELQFQTRTGIDVSSVRNHVTSDFRNDLTTAPNSLSYSLDKGLDEYHEMNKVEDISQTSVSNVHKQRVGVSLGHVGSEPILNSRKPVAESQESKAERLADDGQKKFLQSWQAHGPAPVCSDDDDILQQAHLIAGLDRVSSTVNKINEVSVHVENNISYGELSNDVVNSDLKLFSSVLNEDSVCQKISENCVGEGEAHQYKILSEGSIHHETSATFPGLNFVVKEENHKHSDIHKPSGCSKVDPLSTSTTKIKNDVESVNSPETITMSEVSDLIDSSALVDSMLENVTVRTEALASRSGSFNLVRSRHSSMVEDGNL